MISIEITDYTTVVAFWLAFSRLIAINYQLPIYDNLPIPEVVKVLSTVIMTYCFFPFIEGEIRKDIAFIGIENFGMLTAFFTISGLAVGYFVKSIMQVFISAGEIITQQVGFAAVKYFDQSSGQQIGPFETLIKWTILVIIISSGALLPMFKGAFGTFFSIHAENLGNIAKSHIYFIDLFKGIFLSALLLSSPLIFTNMLINTVLGIIAKLVPQMNVIMVSFAVNIGLGLLVFFATSEEFFRVAFEIYTKNLGDWFRFIL